MVGADAAGADASSDENIAGADAAGADAAGADASSDENMVGADAAGADAATELTYGTAAEAVDSPSALERLGDRAAAEAELEYNDELVNGDDARICEPEAILLSIITTLIFDRFSCPSLCGICGRKHSL
jgi:hypothetical protein